MSSLWQSIRSVFTRSIPVAQPGLYHYQSPADDPRNYRLHLRIEPDGRSILIVNAATVLHLNPTATEYAFYFIHNTSAADVGRTISARYHVSAVEAEQDYSNLAGRVMTLIDTPDLDPVTFLDFSRSLPYSGNISAPYRLDIALTYKLPEGADPAWAPAPRVTRELTTQEWLGVLEKAWLAGIPHIVFTGGEPTLRDDLFDLIAKAESLGQVTGLITDGQKLTDPLYLDRLLRTGLDHLTILLNTRDEGDWQAIQIAMTADVHTTVHLTVSPTAVDDAAGALKRLASLGVPVLSLTASTPETQAELPRLANLAGSLQMQLVWDTAVPYSQHNPVAMQVAPDQPPSGAGRAWCYVEPDGDILPAQGSDQKLGNVLTTDWKDLIKL